MSRLRRTVLALLTLEAAAVLALAVAGGTQAPEAVRAANRHLVVDLGLTDLALASGPSYGRHPTQTDLFAPFSDHPGALEHFPAGSLLPPPSWPDAPASSSSRHRSVAEALRGEEEP